MKHERLRIRDNILEGLLFYISSNPNLNQDIVLRGGNSLHFIYNSPRYSSDLDFVGLDFDNKSLVFQKELIKPIKTKDGKLILIYNLLKNELLRTKYAYEVGEGKPSGRVEIVNDGLMDYKKVEGKFNPLLTATPSEIYADKVFATLNRVARRGSFKGTDLFDLEYITNNLNSEASLEKIEEKARHYGFEGYDRKTVETVLKSINNPELHNTFIRGIRKTMQPNYFKEQTFDKNYFEKCARHFEKLRKI